MSPREFRSHVEGASGAWSDRAKDLVECARRIGLTAGWYAGALARAKEIPPLRSILEPGEAAAEQPTDDDLEEAERTMNEKMSKRRV